MLLITSVISCDYLVVLNDILTPVLLSLTHNYSLNILCLQDKKQSEKTLRN